MPYFGERSEKNLRTCDSRIQTVMRKAIKKWDFSVLQGHRTKEDQNKAFDEGKSQKRYPESTHNTIPSTGIDIAPHPIDYNDLGSFYMLAGYIIRIAEEEGIELRYGGDWDGDKKTADQDFHDLGHIELVK